MWSLLIQPPGRIGVKPAIAQIRFELAAENDFARPDDLSRD